MKPNMKIVDSMKSLLISLLVFLAAGCTTAGMELEKEYAPVTVSRICTTEKGKPYLEVDGKPFAVYGAQIRIDVFRSVDKLDWTQIEDYFRTASEFGVNTVQVPLPWAFLEPRKDTWTFGDIDQILRLANKYDLKVELLWFSTNMIGDSYSWLVPTYILAEPSIRLKRNDDGAWHGLYGYAYSIQMNDAWVLERETNAVNILFRHIREWDENNGNRHPVITCQIHNEPDALVRWRLAEKCISHKDGTPLTQEEAWKMTLDALDAVGKAVKSSPYKIATRTNVISGKGVGSYPQTPLISPAEVYALEGIDFLSFDPYMQTVNEIAYETSQYASLEGNYPLVAENRGDFPNTASLMLVASALGGGYDIYDLATSRYISSNSAPPFNTEGIYESDLTPKRHTASVAKLLQGLTAAGEIVAVTSCEDFAVFNVKEDNPLNNLCQTICTTGAKLTFSTTAGALGFVLDSGDKLTAFATEDATLKAENGLMTDSSDGTIQLKGGIIYELPFKSDGKIQSTVKQNIGTLFN